MLRVKLVKRLCKLLRLPEPFWQVRPILQTDFDKLRRDVSGIPTVMDWETVKSGMWPVPQDTYRVFLGL
jgi:hypothetical protein